MFLCVLGFVVLGFFIVSAEVLAGRIDSNRRFLAILAYDRLITLLVFASLFFDPKDLIAAGLILNGGLDRCRQVLHFDLRFFVFRLCRHAEGEGSADYSCCNKVLRFHGYSFFDPLGAEFLQFFFLCAADTPAPTTRDDRLNRRDALLRVRRAWEARLSVRG